MTKCINGCTREASPKTGLCGNCVKRGGKPPKRRNVGYVYNSEVERYCSRCKRVFPIEEFQNSHHQSRCVECQKWVKRDAYLKQNYGISTEQYEELLCASNGGCYICGKTKDKNGGRYLSVDHDHSCCQNRKSCGKCVRGVLCDTCNRAVGLLQDSPENAMAVALYIKKNAPVDKTLLINLDW